MFSFLKRWTAIVAEFGLSQGLAQAAGMISGLIYVRVMPVDQYALYALCMTGLGLISVGSDLGLTGSLSYFWRKSLQEGQPIAPMLQLVKKLRGGLFAVSFAVAVLLLTTSPVAPATRSTGLILCIALIAVTAWLQMRIGIDVQHMRLEGRQRASYLCESVGSAARLLGAGLMLLSGISVAWFGLAGGLAGAIATTYAILLTRAREPENPARPASGDSLALKNYLLPVVPGVLVFMAQDPIVMWLASRTGGAATIAETFALSRIAAILALAGTFVNVVLAPRLARAASDASFGRSLRNYLAAVTLGGALAVGLVALAPQIPLLITGAKYAHLMSEIVIVTATTSLSIATSLLALSNRTRGWIGADPWFALLQILAIAGLCMIWPLTTTRDVVLLNLILAAIAFITAALTVVLGTARPDLVRIASAPTFVAARG